MSDPMDMSDMLEVFLEEAVEQLQRLDDGFLALEKSPDDLQLVNEVFRAAHTLKGSSATMGFEQIAKLTHSMESLLDGVRSGNQPLRTSGVDALLKSVDILRVLVEQTQSGSGEEIFLEEVLELLAESQCPADAGAETPARSVEAQLERTAIQDACLRIEVHISKECVMPSVRGFMVFNALSGLGDIMSSEPKQESIDDLQSDGRLIVDLRPSVGKEEILRSLSGIGEIDVKIIEPEDQEAQSLPKPKATEAAKSESEVPAHMQTVRVGVDRLDRLMNLVGELVIGRTRIGQIGNVLSAQYERDAIVGDLGEASLQLGRVINELQEQIMGIRMLPVEQVFSRFPRMMRDLSHKAGKKIDFVISGQETELDRSILEDIVDPITHLLRNAVDHGIESEAERRAAGKPEVATVRLVAKHEENRIVIEVQDDGHGIDAEAVRRAAVAKGKISQEAADRLSEQECLQLIFGAGVSTAKEVTDISGRGVGMDVVRSNIERLSGSVEIHTEVGVGTTISMRLPLTLAIVQALVTMAENRIFAIPLTAVVETSRCRASDLSTIEGYPVLQFRGSVLPVVNLKAVFPCEETVQSEVRSDAILVVVRAAGQLIGLAVDSLVGEQEVVIKSLGSYFGEVKGVSGAALLGDGKIALIVDVAGLPPLMRRQSTAA